MSGASEFLLSDAAAALSRQLTVRPQTDLALVFANWIGAMPEDMAEIQHVVSAAAARTGAQQDFQSVAALGFALHGGLVDSAANAALKQGIERLTGRQPFVDEVPMPFCSDAVGLLGVALGARSLADASLIEKVIGWLRIFVKKMYEMEGTEDWQRCIYHATDQVFEGKVGLLPVASKEAADVRAALAARGVIPLTTNPESEEHAVYGLLAQTSCALVSFEHAAIRMASLKWLTRVAPVAIPGRMKAQDLVRILERVPAGLRNWTWEKAPRTAKSTPCQWHINNEYHVQNLLWLLLAPTFPDLDDEQYLAKIGQKSPRSDLHIPSMKLIVEVKFVRPGDTFQKIIDEISSDASLYKALGNDCRDIVVFIWDDSARSHEHDYLKQGLKRLPGITDVVIVSRPSDWKVPT
jgi:hypothetical protein